LDFHSPIFSGHRVDKENIPASATVQRQPSLTLPAQTALRPERGHPPHMGAIAQVIDLVKDYHMEEVVVPALRGVTLTFDEGDFIALMGPSGSGKSTLLNLLGCLDRCTSGQYILGDEDVAQMNDDQLSEVRSKYIGFIFQSYNLLPQYTVVENIEI